MEQLIKEILLYSLTFMSLVSNKELKLWIVDGLNWCFMLNASYNFPSEDCNTEKQMVFHSNKLLCVYWIQSCLSAPSTFPSSAPGLLLCPGQSQSCSKNSTCFSRCAGDGKGLQEIQWTTEQDKHTSSWLFLPSQCALAGWASSPAAAGAANPGKLGGLGALGKQQWISAGSSSPAPAVSLLWVRSLEVLLTFGLE